jgi:AcrR family transcriptional regulator
MIWVGKHYTYAQQCSVLENAGEETLTRRGKPAEARKGEIVESARRLFFRRGYAKTTITEIIEDAEISKGLFYYYFGSKEDILDTIVEQLMVEDVAALQKILDHPSLTTAEKLMSMLRSHRSLIGDERGHIAAQLRAIDNPEIVIRTIRLSVLRLSRLFAEVVERGVVEGLFHIENPQHCIDVLLGAYTFEAVFGDVALSASRRVAFRQIWERTLGAEPDALNVWPDQPDRF